jgi:hypothetical protein
VGNHARSLHPWALALLLLSDKVTNLNSAACFHKRRLLVYAKPEAAEPVILSPNTHKGRCRSLLVLEGGTLEREKLLEHLHSILKKNKIHTNLH